MRSMLLAALCVALPLSAAHAADAVEVLPDPANATGEVTEVGIDHMAFLTPEVKIKAGQIVRWKNAEAGTAHNVHLRGGPAKGFAKAMGPMLNTGDSYALKFNEPGTYNYICTPHSAMMKAKVIVE